MVFAIDDIDGNGRRRTSPDDKTRRRDDEPIHERFSREVEVGNVEYKLKLVTPSAARFQQLVTQLKYRLAEGGGQAIYEIGVEDDGNLKGLDADEMRASLATLSRMCASLDATMRVLHRRRAPAPDGEKLEVAEVLVQALADPAKAEVRVACIGASQSGKSTLLGVLSTGALDDGHGSARMTVLRHMHEIESGATSCISQQVLGFDGGGRLLNSSEPLAPTGAEIVEQAARIITMLDLCGQERFLKTTLSGLTAHTPDCALLAVAADAGASSVTRLHLAVAAALLSAAALSAATVATSTAAAMYARLHAIRRHKPQVRARWQLGCRVPDDGGVLARLSATRQL